MFLLKPGTFLLGFLFSCHFFHPLQEVALALTLLNRLSAHISSLGKSTALTLFVYSDAHGMLGDFANTSSFAMITLKDYSF